MVPHREGLMVPRREAEESLMVVSTSELGARI